MADWLKISGGLTQVPVGSRTNVWGRHRQRQQLHVHQQRRQPVAADPRLGRRHRGRRGRYRLARQQRRRHLPRHRRPAQLYRALLTTGIPQPTSRGPCSPATPPKDSARRPGRGKPTGMGAAGATARRTAAVRNGPGLDGPRPRWSAGEGRGPETTPRGKDSQGEVDQIARDGGSLTTVQAHGDRAGEGQNESGGCQRHQRQRDVEHCGKDQTGHSQQLDGADGLEYAESPAAGSCCTPTASSRRRRTDPIDERLQLLRTLLTRAPQDLEDTCDLLLNQPRHPGSRDDVALLLTCLAPGPVSAPPGDSERGGKADQGQSSGPADHRHRTR
ncbi:hypothetical protein STENM36S_07604 [Streptomyces tendae]